MTHQRQTADEDHGDDCRLEVFVLDEPECLDPERPPALPEGAVAVPGQAGEAGVAVVWAAVGRVLLHHQFLGRGLEDLGLKPSLDLRTKEVRQNLHKTGIAIEFFSFYESKGFCETKLVVNSV